MKKNEYSSSNNIRIRMECTYNHRRKCILEKAMSSSEILKLYPYLAVEEEVRVYYRNYCLEHLFSHPWIKE